jgi:hypothetical protein
MFAIPEPVILKKQSTKSTSVFNDKIQTPKKEGSKKRLADMSVKIVNGTST